MSRPRIVTVGGCGVSLLFSLDRNADDGETVLARAMTFTNGGKASNQAIGASRLGADSVLVSAVGRDDFALRVRQLLQRERVDDGALVEFDDEPTMVGVVLVDALGTNRITAAPGALRRIEPEHVRACAHHIAAADICLVSLEIPVEAAREALSIARDHGVTTILNPAPAPSPAEAARLLPLSDYVTPNAIEAVSMTQTNGTHEELAAAMVAGGASAVALTLGERGAFVLSGGRIELVPAVEVEHVVDTNGAGDAFNSALAVALAQGASPVEASREGCRAGALIVQRFGFVEALDTWDGFTVATP